MISNEGLGSSFVKTKSIYMKSLINIYYKFNQHILEIQLEYIRKHNIC